MSAESGIESGAESGTENEGTRLGVLRFGDLNVQLPRTFTMKHLNLNHEQNKKCKFCSARTWKEESINCCGKGKFVVHKLKPLPADVLTVFSTPAFF